ncbi:MAG: GlxA family transcriptional regulator [Gammaproteobacteria bacterium]
MNTPITTTPAATGRTVGSDAATGHDVVFVLVPKFSMIALYGALEPLRVANRFAGEVFQWRFVSVDGQPVAASNGIPVSAGGDLKSIGHPSLAVLCASYEPESGRTRPLLAAIRRLAREGVALAGMDTGPLLLAAAGALDGHRATCHWESLPGFREDYPRVQATQSLYEIDRGRVTCAGGSAAIDMMLALIEGWMGRALAVTVADQLLHFRGTESRAPARARHGTDDPRLLSIIAAMEEATEEPLSAAELARIGGLSARQMERLFRERLGSRPMGYYLKLRLEKAERLLRYSHMTVRDIALACGFGSLAQFSRAFRQAHGQPPTQFRSGRVPAVANHSPSTKQ